MGRAADGEADEPNVPDARRPVELRRRSARGGVRPAEGDEEREWDAREQELRRDADELPGAKRHQRRERRAVEHESARRRRRVGSNVLQRQELIDVALQHRPRVAPGVGAAGALLCALMHTRMGMFESAYGLAAMLVGLMLVLAGLLTWVQYGERE